MKIFAKFVSIVFGPAIIWPITLLLFILKTTPEKDKVVLLIPGLLFLQIIIPLGYIYLLFRKNKIKDLDLTYRQERYAPLSVAFVCLLVSLIFVYYFGNSALFNFFLLTTALLAVNIFVTFFWKISLHMTLNVIASFFINLLFTGRFPILYLSLPLVFWSRLYLKKHTVAQLLAGFVLNVGMILFLSLTFKHLFNFF